MVESIHEICFTLIAYCMHRREVEPHVRLDHIVCIDISRAELQPASQRGTEASCAAALNRRVSLL
jgi:hypothetical protein